MNHTDLVGATILAAVDIGQDTGSVSVRTSRGTVTFSPPRTLGTGYHFVVVGDMSDSVGLPILGALLKPGITECDPRHATTLMFWTVKGAFVALWGSDSTEPVQLSITTEQS